MIILRRWLSPQTRGSCLSIKTIVMRKYSLLVLALTVLTITGVGCFPTLDKPVRIPLTFATEASFSLPPTDQTGPQELASGAVPNDLRDFLEQNNARMENVEKATIKEIGLTLATPGLTFGMLSDLKVEIDVRGKRVPVGKVNVESPEGVQLNIPVENEVDVLEILLEEKFNFILSGTLREPLEQEAKIDAQVSYGLNLIL